MPEQNGDAAIRRATDPALTPAQESRNEPANDGKHDIALCLSGGGYRAMLFHLGSLWRLNELGYMKEVDRFSSVSGGSITAGVLGMNWNRLQFGAGGAATNFGQLVVEPLRNLARQTIDEGSIFEGLFSPSSIGEEIAQRYTEHVFGDATLQALPDHPRFVINATNVQSRSLFRFSKPFIWDYRVGKIERPNVALSLAVAASSAFPPLLSPLEMHFKESDWVPGSGAEPGTQSKAFKETVLLTDGGVYDNLGLETAWKSHAMVLVSDGGGETPIQDKPKRDWARHAVRVLELVDYQVRALRKRQLIASFIAGEKKGAYWGMRVDIADYGLPDALPAPYARTLPIANTPTRLKAMEDRLQEQIINWGYASCDAAMRRHVDPSLPAPKGFPYPGGV